MIKNIIHLTPYNTEYYKKLHQSRARLFNLKQISGSAVQKFGLNPLSYTEKTSLFFSARSESKIVVKKGENKCYLEHYKIYFSIGINADTGEDFIPIVDEKPNEDYCYIYHNAVRINQISSFLQRYKSGDDLKVDFIYVPKKAIRSIKLKSKPIDYSHIIEGIERDFISKQCDEIIKEWTELDAKLKKYLEKEKILREKKALLLQDIGGDSIDPILDLKEVFDTMKFLNLS